MSVNNKTIRVQKAEETLEILKRGFYSTQRGKVNMASEIENSIKNAVLLQEHESRPFISEKRETSHPTHFSCLNESTVTAIHRLYHNASIPIGVLNFASAKHPGGGFRAGAVAQEETLAISSGLYLTQTHNKSFYDINMSRLTPYYTNTSIYSPDVPFFRDDNLELTPRPSLASVLTIPAVNMNLVGNNKSNEKSASDAMRYRMHLCLAIFSHFRAEHLVLGAFGCGVFKQLPENVARWWCELFEGEFRGVFRTVHFAVYDRSKKEDNFRFFEQMSERLMLGNIL